MRRILFRGKSIEKGIWLYGDLIHCDDETQIDTASFFQAVNCPVFNVEFVNPETVGQFTGNQDKNGKDIFEGDIVEYSGDLLKVVFEQRNGAAYFGIVISEIETWGFNASVPAHQMKVIGNIFDNPELIGGVEK